MSAREQGPGGEGAAAAEQVVPTAEAAASPTASLKASEAGPVPALSLRGFGVSFAGTEEPASAEIDLDLVPGRVLALVGESGSGKSVTAMGALGLLPPTAVVTGSAVVIDGAHPVGDVYRTANRTASDGSPGADSEPGTQLVGAPREVLDDVRGRLVGTVFQEPTTALDPLETIASQIGEAVRIHAAGRQRRSRVHARVLELLRRVGLGDGDQVERIARSYPHQLSGGQLQRACIALAMAADPPVLIADEPTTALDVTVQAGILDLLRSLTDSGIAVLLITHDMGVVADVADDVAVMRHGRIVERGRTRELFARPGHPYTRALLAAVPRLESLRAGAVEDYVGNAVGNTQTSQEGRLSASASLGGAGGAAPTTGAPGDGQSQAEPVVEIRGLDVVYRNRRRRVHAVQDVSLHIDAGEVLGLVGESGSGKSTIAGTLTGLVPVVSGSVRVCGVEVAGAGRRALLPARRATGVVYQNPASSLNPRRTVRAAIAEPMLVHGGYTSAERRGRVRELLDAVRLPVGLADRYPHEMSGGQRQRVAIARALALDPRLVIADEPTSALDVPVQAVVLELLRQLQAELGFACLFVSHDLAVVDSLATRTVVLAHGQVVEAGPTRQVLAHPREEYTRRLVGAVPIPDPDAQARRRAARLRAA
ncbi:dipeptide ABC transporter ATP-binding protein [Actinomyces ruminicola]|uniref:Peptide/nickel transport system ATP-binding protein n=1 Tax=Actinomyces ruminicola TaxID=332524 RepID=A0A1G9RTZ6_9ACTO|nr:ABC transporter ATP-binding protein [Actinomyces ruminicola]SDM26652.1 peptide/nickel transport system ATP-binding protein [Actinomyces ruminicola]